MKRSATWLPVARGPINNNEFKAYSAEDSTSIVIMTLYNSPIPPGLPMAARMFLQCRRSRMTIMRVRRTLSETEVEKYGRPMFMEIGVQMLLSGCEPR